MRVLLAEDHALVRAGIRALVAALPDITEILEAADGEEAVAAVAAYRPDVVLMDLSMPRMNGFEATARIVKESPNTRVIILSVHRNEEFVFRAVRAGASGYLLKARTVEELQQALHAVDQGQGYVSPPVREAFGLGKSGELSPLERLTPRQREVLQLIAEGLSNRQIAQALSVHPKTIDSHRTQLMKLLGIHNVAGLVRFAIRNGLVPEQ
jgi:DNA-binding NarL/FixJ family response regulator